MDQGERGPRAVKQRSTPSERKGGWLPGKHKMVLEKQGRKAQPVGSGFLPIFVALTPICAGIPRFAIQIYITQLIPYDEPAKLCSDNLSPKRQIFEIPSFFSSPERGEG